VDGLDCQHQQATAERQDTLKPFDPNGSRLFA